MVKQLLTIFIVAAICVANTVVARSLDSKNAKPQKSGTSISKSKASSRTALEVKKASASNTLLPRNNYGTDSQNDVFGIVLPSSDSSILPFDGLTIGKTDFFLGDRTSFSGSENDGQDGSLFSQQDPDISRVSFGDNGLTYSLAKNPELKGNLNGQEEKALDTSKQKKNSPTYGIKPALATQSPSTPSFGGINSKKVPFAFASNSSDKVPSFADAPAKSLSSVNFGTGFTALDEDDDDDLDSSLQPTKGVSAAIPLAGGNFNIGVSYVVGRLNGIYQDKSDFSKQYANWVDDKYGLVSLNLQYSHAIGKQTSWYGYAGYTTGNKLLHNNESLSNLFGSTSTSGYAVQFGLKHSF